MKRMGKVIGSSLFSLLLLLGLVLPMQTTVPVLQPMTVAANDLTGHLPANPGKSRVMAFMAIRLIMFVMVDQ